MPTGIVSISEYAPNPPIQVSADSLLEVRGFYDRDFIGGDAVTPIYGNTSNGEQGPYYYLTTPTINGSGNLVVPQHDVQATTLSNPTANYFEGLWVDGAFVQWLMPNTQGASGWQIPTVYGTPINIAQIALYNRAKRLLYPNDQYLTEDQTILLIRLLSGNFDYMAVGVNGIGQASFPPVVASAPIVLMENDPRVGSWFNILSYGAATTNTALQNTVAIGLARVAAAAVGGGIFIPVGTFLVNSMTLSVPVVFAPGASILSVVTGQTVTITQDIVADRSKHFANALASQGTISFIGNNSLVWGYPEWWGGIPGASTTTQMKAFQAAVDSGINVSLAVTQTGTSYQLDNSIAPLTLNNSTYSTATIKGGGQNTTLIRFTSTANPGILIDYPHSGAPSAYLSDFYMRGPGGATPSFVAGNYGIYVPGYHDGVNHVISNLVIENIQIDQFCDSGICIRGETGPVKVENPVLNDNANYQFQIAPDDNPSHPGSSQDVVIRGGSMQGAGAKGGISIVGPSDAPIGSLTIADCDIELGAGQTKPVLNLEQVHGALFSGMTLASNVASLSTGDANVYIGAGVYGCEFQSIVNAVNTVGNINNVNAASSAVLSNTFDGGEYSNRSGGTGYFYTQTVGAQNNWFKGISFSNSNFATDHEFAPMSEVVSIVNLGTIATTGATSGVTIAEADGFVTAINFAGGDNLTASDTNYITFTVRNLGPSGSGIIQLLATSNANTTKATGGFSIAANVIHALTINGTAGAWPLASAMKVAKGDRLLVTATVTNTLANTVTFSQVQIYLTEFMPTGP